MSPDMRFKKNGAAKIAGRIGFIGLGIMAKPMAKNLLKAGCLLGVYNRGKAQGRS